MIRKPAVPILLFGLLLIGVIPLGAQTDTTPPVPKQAPHKPVFQKGMTCVPWFAGARHFRTDAGTTSLDNLARTGTEWVALVPGWFMENKNSSVIKPHTRKTLSDEDLIFIIDELRKRKMKILLKPHVGCLDGTFRGEIKPADVEAWFTSYETFILHYADLAAEKKLEGLCIGCELGSMTIPDYKAHWEKIIARLRKRFPGFLTYAANGNPIGPAAGKYARQRPWKYAPFWDKLDYAGIDAYFKLSRADQPTQEELKQSWQTWAKEIEAWQATHGKPVLFTEIGYRITNPDIQAKSYEAALDVLWDKLWFHGMYWWCWFANPDRRWGMSPQNMPALDVLKKWYTRPAPQKTTNRPR